MTMNKTLGIFLIFALTVVLIFIMVRKVGEASYANDEFGIKFEYSDDYRIEERSDQGRYSLVLLPVDYTPPENGEGPPAINFDLYFNPGVENALEWVQGNQNSNFQLSNQQYEAGVVGGEPAVMYRSDGLYATDNVVVLNRDYVLHISSGFIAEDDQIRDDFEDVLDSLKLY